MEGTLVSLIRVLYEIYFYMIIAYILLSWVPNARESFIGTLLGKFVEPYLSPFRRFIPPIGGVIDVSPIVAILALFFVQEGLIKIVSTLF